MAAKVIKVFTVSIYFLIMVYAAAQETSPETAPDGTMSIDLGTRSVITAKRNDAITLDERKSVLPNSIANEQLQQFRKLITDQHKPVHTSPSGDLVSSFRSSVHFGGFWDKYVIINFTPDVYLKPSGSISIYASHLSSMWIPVHSIRSYFNSLAAEGFAIGAIETSVRLLGLNKYMASSVLSFLLKNVLMSILEPAPKQNGLIKYKFYYYSMSIVL
jgi:hypothetical protein